MKTADMRNQAGEVWKRIQSEYGAKPKPQREIKKQLDKDDFMKIMITQMQHQDPTNPMDSDKLAAEIAQITSVEQLQNVNHALNKMNEKSKPLERLTMTNLIGKVVTVDENRFVHVAGENENIRFQLPENIAKGKLTLISSTGEKVLERDLGAMPQGTNSINWDGKKSNTLEAGSGAYLVRIEGETQEGAPVTASALSKSVISGVSFEGSEPVFVIQAGNSQKRIGMDSIITIEDGSSIAPQNATAPPRGDGSQPQMGSQLIDNSGAKRNVSQFFTFEKGKGSQTLSPEQIDSNTEKLLKSYQPDSQVPTGPKRPIEQGFPNGLGAVQRNSESEPSQKSGISEKIARALQ
jgi:flagellar basal-body rod modification protein FlgD